MLHDLYQYALTRGLTGGPGFARKKADWVIHLTPDGALLDVVRESLTLDNCPDLTQSELVGGSTPRSHFLLDARSTVIGGEGKSAAKHLNFVDLLEKATEGAPLLKACHTALTTPKTLEEISARLESLKAKATDKVTFRVDGQLVTQDTSWHGWWRAYRASISPAKPKAGEEMRCFVTGQSTVPARTHPKINGLSRVGGQPSGSSLIGFDKESFGSYGLEQSLNAACSEEAAVAYRNALNYLVENAQKPLAGSLTLHWYKEPVPEEDDLLLAIDTPLADLDAADSPAQSREVTRLLEAIRDGRRPDLLMNRYYALVVSGSGGRVMIRDWSQGSFIDLVESVETWFTDLDISTPQGGGLAASPKLFLVATRLLDRRPRETIRDLAQRMDSQLTSLMPRLWYAILHRTPVPDDVARRALLFIRSSLLASGEDSSQNLDRVACSMLKVWYNRLCRQNLNGGRCQVSPQLEHDHPSVAYQAGRMMAVLAEIQRRALGDVGAGIVQRYYASASSTPALVLGRLIRTSQYHLDKLSKPAAIYYDRLLGEIAGKIGSSVPSSFSLEEQTLFALGYYQQRAARATTEDQTENKEAN